MANEIISVNVPQCSDDIDIFEDLKAMLMTRGFAYIDMEPGSRQNYTEESVTYRFQREEKKQDRR